MENDLKKLLSVLIGKKVIYVGKIHDFSVKGMYYRQYEAIIKEARIMQGGQVILDLFFKMTDTATGERVRVDYKDVPPARDFKCPEKHSYLLKD